MLWGIIMIKKAMLIFVILLFSIGVVSAERYIRYNIESGTLVPGGYIPSGEKLYNTHSQGYLCNGLSCDPPIKAIGGLTKSSGSSNAYNTLTFPSTLPNGDSYGIFFYKPGWITWEQSGITYAGTKPGESTTSPTTNSNKIILTKAQMCRAQVDTFSIKNDLKPHMPLVVNIGATLDADTKAALNHAGPIDYIPANLLDDYYSLKTEVRLEIFYSDGSHAFDESRELLIEFSDRENTEFHWTPEISDDYTAVISSYVTDEKCMDSEEMASYQWFSVWEEEPNKECYTLLDDLNATNHIDIMEGEEVKISVSKLSNMVVGDELTPLPTDLELSIRDENGNEIYNEIRDVSANSNPFDFEIEEFTWIADHVGYANFIVFGVAEDCPFEDNSDYIVSMDYFVINKPACYEDNECGDDSYIGDSYC